jgi:hypothetical protein
VRITNRVRDMKVRTAGDCRRSAGVSPAVAGASSSRTSQLLTAQKKRQIEAEGEAQQGAGRMPAPQRARRPRYIRCFAITSMPCTLTNPNPAIMEDEGGGGAWPCAPTPQLVAPDMTGDSSTLRLN